MKGLRKVLTPFAPDQSGAVSVLYGLGGMTVIIDAGGCTGNICGFDEPAAAVTISYTAADRSEQMLRLTIGNRLPDRSGRYVRLGDESTVYFLPTELLDPLMRLASEGLAE